MVAGYLAISSPSRASVCVCGADRVDAPDLLTPQRPFMGKELPLIGTIAGTVLSAVRTYVVYRTFLHREVLLALGIKCVEETLPTN